MSDMLIRFAFALVFIFSVISVPFIFSSAVHLIFFYRIYFCLWFISTVKYQKISQISVRCVYRFSFIPLFSFWKALFSKIILPLGIRALLTKGWILVWPVLRATVLAGKKSGRSTASYAGFVHVSLSGWRPFSAITHDSCACYHLAERHNMHLG